MAQQYRSSRSRSGGGGRSRSGSGGGSRGGSRSGGGQGGRSGGRSSGRGGGRGAPARSSGGNGPMVIAILLVVGVIALVVFLTSGKGKEEQTEHVTKYPPMTGQNAGTSETEPAKPPPYPEINMDLKKQAMALATQAKELAKQGEAVYDEAMKARRDGNDELWQDKLAAASEYFYEIRELWNELIAQMPSNDHYDEEQVANHYLGREGSIVSKALSRLTDIKKQRRL